MLTRLKVRNFKTLEDIDIELGQAVVFVGPNNSGKTSALQALALWQSGAESLRRLGLDRVRDPERGKLTVAAVNRLALTHAPVSDTRHFWHGLRLEADGRVGKDTAGLLGIMIRVEGESISGAWSREVGFFYLNTESVLCLPTDNGVRNDQLLQPFTDQIPPKIAFLPPMSGLVAEEPEIQPGRIDVLIGEGQTAQVLRNLCLRVSENDPPAWKSIRDRMRAMFGIDLHGPDRALMRGSITLQYTERGYILDIASAGRGLQQTLLLLAHIHANPGSVLLLDEPDAHLEILRQREIYNVLTDAARETGSQIIAATHSEVILNEAAQRDTVIAFVGRKPHRIIDRGSQLLKSLKEIGFDQYYQADLKGAVIYLEGATDLAILRALAKKLSHPAAAVLERPFAHYVSNRLTAAQHHFAGLREARPDLVGFALFDRLDRGLPDSFALPVHCWRKYEIENYIATRDVLLAFAQGDLTDRSREQDAMRQSLDAVEQAFRTLGIDPWGDNVKMSEQVLPAIFKNYYNNLQIKNEMAKADFHVLVHYLDPAAIDPEVTTVLDALFAVIEQARPAS